MANRPSPSADRAQRRGHLLRASTAAAVVAALLTVHLPVAEARWNPRKFSGMLATADEQFTGGAYAEALESYKELKVYLDASLAAEEIPEEQVARARQALGTIKYQIARTTQLTAGCDAGYLAFRELRIEANLEFAVAVKVEARMAETLLCRARMELDGGDIESATRDLDQARSLLAATGERRLHVALSEAQAADIKDGLQKTGRDVVAWIGARDDWTPTECEVADLVSDIADTMPTGVELSGIDPVRGQLVTQCPNSRFAAAEQTTKEVEPPSAGGEIPWGPLVTAGVGGLALIGVAVNELRLIPTIDDFEAARSTCVVPSDPACTEAKLLAADVEGGQFISMAFLGVGLAALTGAAVWWYLGYQGSGETAPPASAFQIAPVAGGAMAGWSSTF